MPLITDERLERSLAYIAETDDEHAKLKTDMLRNEFKAKKVKAAVFLHMTGTVAEREAQAMASDDYDEGMKSYFEVCGKFNALDNRRDREFIVIDVFRTISANSRRGNI